MTLKVVRQEQSKATNQGVQKLTGERTQTGLGRVLNFTLGCFDDVRVLYLS